MLGWCTAMIIASRAANRVDKLIWCGAATLTSRPKTSNSMRRLATSTAADLKLADFCNSKCAARLCVSGTWSGWTDAFRKVLGDGDGCHTVQGKRSSCAEQRMCSYRSSTRCVSARKHQSLNVSVSIHIICHYAYLLFYMLFQKVLMFFCECPKINSNK